MGGEAHHSGKQGKRLKLQLFLGGICLLCILAVSSLFFITNSESKKASLPVTAHITATATPSPSPAPQPILMPTPQPLFYDYFDSNSKGWLTSDVSGYTRVFNESGLVLSDTNHKILVESLPTSTTFDNFILTTTFTLEQGDENDSVGLYLRGDNNLDHDYRVDIYGNTTYAISKESLDSNRNQITTLLFGPSQTPALKSIGHENTLTVIMNGPTMMLMINGFIVHTMSDPDYTRGQIALFVQNGSTSDGVQAAFSSIVVYPVPQQWIATPTVTPTPAN